MEKIMFTKLYRKICDIFRNRNKAYFETSPLYWDFRYKTGGNSGSGSYGRLARFKAEVINNFIEKEDIQNIIEFGHGDGNQLKLFKCKEYTGIDVSKTVVNKCKKMFADDTSKKFYHTSEMPNIYADLCLSLDVIYHLIEDDIFEEYMSNLFFHSKKYVIIYSSDKETPCKAKHVKHRKFTAWVQKHIPEWKLINFIENRYPTGESDANNNSFANFYIYRKKQN